MDNSIFLEEEQNLIDNLNRIDLLISKLNQKINSYNYELENAPDNKRKEELLEKKEDRLAEINNLRELKKSPYFGHLVLECQGELLNIFVGEKTIYLDGEFIVYDYRNPLCVLFYSNQNTFKYNGDIYKLKIKRKLIIKEETLKECFEDSVLFENKIFENRSSNYFKTITSEQNMIMRFDKNNNIFINGDVGTGKSTTLFYRMSSLNYNYPAINLDSYLYITSRKEKFNELIKTLNLENITIMNISEYYMYCLKQLFNNKELNKININFNNKFNKDIIDSEFEKKTLNLIYNKYNDDVLEEINRFTEEFKINNKEFNNLSVFEKYKKVEEIININLNEELDKINILTNNLSGWLSSIYTELEDNISSKSKNNELDYKFNNTNRKNQLLKYMDDLSSNLESKITAYTSVDKGILNDYLKLNNKLSKNINTVINTLSNNNIEINFSEYNFKLIIDEFNKYKDNIVKLINDYKEELTNVNSEIENFKLKVFRNNLYNKLLSRKDELDNLIKDLEYKIFILIDIENKYILKFEDDYNEVINLEGKLDNNYLNLLELKKYFDKIKSFILLVFEYDKYIELNNLITDKILSILNLFKDKMNGKVRYFDFIYKELFNSICNDIKFNNIDIYNDYLNDIEYKCSNRYLLDTFISSSKVVYGYKNFELDNLNIYRLLFITCVTGYYISLSSKFIFIFIDDIDDYSLFEIELIKNTSMNSYFNITSRDSSLLKNISKIIDGKIYTLNINMRNTSSLVKYCNNKFGFNIKGSNNIGNEVKELEFISYKDTLDLIRTYSDIVLIGEEKYLEYFRSNGVVCYNVTDKLDEYNNIVLFEDSNWDDDIKYNIYIRCLNDLIIYNTNSIPDTINDLDII